MTKAFLTKPYLTILLMAAFALPLSSYAGVFDSSGRILYAGGQRVMNGGRRVRNACMGFLLPLVKVNLEVQEKTWTVLRFSPDAEVPAWVNLSGFKSVTYAPGELSIVVESQVVPPELQDDNDWTALRISGTLDFGLIGILRSVVDPLALGKISVFALSTYDTDYIMVRTSALEATKIKLKQFGHTISEASTEKR